jgi:lipoprotein-anchoring transpeptidase ErfK/SrfK
MRHILIKTRLTFLAIIGLLLFSLALAACGEPAATYQPAATTSTGTTPTPTARPTTLPPTTAPATTSSTAVTPTTTASGPTPTASPSPASTTKPVEPPAPTVTPVITFKPVIWFSANALKVGDTLSVSGSGYPANTTLDVLLIQGNDGQADPSANPVTDARGNFKANLKLDKSKAGTPFTAGKVLIRVIVQGGALGASAPGTLLEAATPAPPTKSPEPTPQHNPGTLEHWVDVNLTTQTSRFMEGNKVIRTSLITSGKRGHETPTGTFYINRRVYNETMVGGTPGAEDYYYLKDVLYTQYFTNQGHALHYAWWRTQFGVPGSHGCINEDLATAKFAWDFLTIGSRVTIHY